MATFKCKMCGGALEVNERMTVCECEYCGTKQTLPKITDDQKIGMFNRANHFRQQCEFDKAAEIYEKLAAESGNDAELFWSLVLCRYGIEYVDDPITKNKIPTCHRTQFKSILEDPDYHTALEYADSIQRKVYEQEASKIFNIQKGIIEISNKEEPYDVFICYKETDENGRRTPDSVLAQDLYYGLTQEGFKVFFSRITLESKLGTEYEPYIFAALNSSKVMVVVGTKPEYFNATWVHNEWSRYLQLMQNDKSKIIIPAYKDMDPYELPDSLSLFQSQDMSKIGFLQDLIRGIKKVTNKIDEQNNDRSIEKSAPVTNMPFSQVPADKEKKKPTFIYAFIGLVIFLGIGIFCGMLLTKNKDNKDSDNSSNNKVIEATSEKITDEVTTVSAQQNNFKNIITTQEANTETATNAPLFSEKEIETAKDNAVADFKNNLKAEYNINDENLPELKITIDYDINGDDIPELIISYIGMAGHTEHYIYYYDGSKFIELKVCWGGLDISEDNHIICERHDGTGGGSNYYEISNDYKLNKIDDIRMSTVQNVNYYYRNGQQIDESEYNAAVNYYKDMNWISITSVELKEKTSSNGSTGNASNNLSMYSGYDYIENAPSDMTFVDNSNQRAVPQGIINTDSSALNLRKGPGTSYDVICKIPKGEKVYVYGSNTKWCYVGYASGTGKFTHTDYGYVSKEYVSLTQKHDGSSSSSTVIDGVTVYDCERYGKINTHGGTLPSITLDYITGGEWKTVKDSLENGLNIKAVRYCSTMGITWYEISSSNGSDYYGWIDGEFIDFNN